MTSQEDIIIKASLQEDKGYWVVRGRVPDPKTGKMRLRSKSTKLPVKGNNKRKAEAVMREIIQDWEQEASRGSGKDALLFSEYVDKWLKRRQGLGIKENTLQGAVVRRAKVW